MGKIAFNKIKKIQRVVLLSSLLLLVHGLCKAQADFCGLKNTSFKVGEKITYKAYYNMGMIWIAAGIANFTVHEDKADGKDYFHVMGDGKTLKSYEWFYKVNDLYESWIDQETLLPKKFSRKVNEGNISFSSVAKFDQVEMKIYSDNKVYNSPKCVQDVLSSIYYARNIDYNKYSPGAKIPFNMFLDDKVYNLYIKYLGKEIITTRYGTFKTIKIKPLLIEGTIFKDGDKMTVWVSDDANHIPVRIESPIIIGSIKVDMLSYRNLRSPLSSLIRKGS